MPRLRTLLVLLAIAVVVASCGGSSGSSSTAAGTSTGSSSTSPPAPRSANLVLDFTPNAIHAGIYTALARHYDRANHVALHVIAPSASTDAVKLLETGRTDFAILDIHDLAIARARGADLVGIMAIVQQPLAAVIAAPAVTDPSRLQGKLVGVTGAPSDTAVLNSIVTGAGGDPERVKTISIGFNAVTALLSGRVQGATAFWNDEGLTIKQRRPGFHVFRVERYGAPSYPELVLCATAPALKHDPELAREVVSALVHGYRQVIADPPSGVAALTSQVKGLDRQLVTEQLNAEIPAFQLRHTKVGELDPTTLNAWAKWEAKFGLVKEPPDVPAMFDVGLATAAS